MRRFDRPTEKKTEHENEAHGKLKPENSQSDNGVSKTVTLDDDTMREVLKHLNYCQLAKSSLVSKRYRNLIQKNRHKLALLNVIYVGMRFVLQASYGMKVFGKYLSPEAYNDWVICNHYSQQRLLEGQIDKIQNTPFCQLWAYADYKDQNNVGPASVFNAYAKLYFAEAPLFQHFVRLLTDPFIHIGVLELVTQIDVSNLLARAIEPLKCSRLRLNSGVDAHYFREKRKKSSRG